MIIQNTGHTGLGFNDEHLTGFGLILRLAHRLLSWIGFIQHFTTHGVQQGAIVGPLMFYYVPCYTAWKGLLKLTLERKKCSMQLAHEYILDEYYAIYKNCVIIIIINIPK